MKIEIKGSRDNYRSDDERAAAYLHELRNDTSLSKLLRERSTELGGSVDFVADVPQMPEHLQADDGLGCVIAAYRMILEAQNKPDPGQDIGRQTLTEKGFVPHQGGMATISEESAMAIGIESPMNVGRLEDGGDLADAEGEEIKSGHWPSRLLMAIKKGNVVAGAMPMKFIYDECDLNIDHAFVIRGVRYNDGKMSFLINDPLGKQTEISDEKMVAGGMVNPTFIAAPHGHMLEEGVKLRARTKHSPIIIKPKPKNKF